MSVTGQVLAPTELPRRIAPLCRRLQFRLRTLLILPLVLVLLYQLSGPWAYQLLLLGLALGGIFGSVRAIDRMRDIGPAVSGGRRLVPVLLAAAWGGTKAGILFGPVAMWIVLLREDRGVGGISRSEWAEIGRYFFSDWTNASELLEVLYYLCSHLSHKFTTIALFGSSLGAIIGLLGGLLVGPAAAYLSLTIRPGSRSSGSAVDRPLTETPSRSVATPQAWGRARRLALIGAYSVALLGFPTWFACNCCRKLRDLNAVRALTDARCKPRADWQSTAPEWASMQFVPGFVLQHCRRLCRVDIDVDVNERTADAIRKIAPIPATFMWFSSTDEDLRQLAKDLSGISVPEGDITFQLILNGGQYTADAVVDLVRRCPDVDVRVSDRTIAETAFQRLSQESSFRIGNDLGTTTYFEVFGTHCGFDRAVCPKDP